jgi:hypothetical protein
MYLNLYFRSINIPVISFVYLYPVALIYKILAQDQAIRHFSLITNMGLQISMNNKT